MRDKLALGDKVSVVLQVEVDGEKFQKTKHGIISEIRSFYDDRGHIVTRYTAREGRPQEWFSPKIIAKDVEASAFGIEGDG